MHGITEPSEADRTWLTALTTAMPPLDSEEDLRGLSEMFDAQKAFWHASPPEERDEPHSIVNVFAASVGEYVAARCGLRWASITDEHGTEMGLTDQAGSIAVFPINGIAKRWSGEAPGTLADYAFAIIQGLDHR